MRSNRRTFVRGLAAAFSAIALAGRSRLAGLWPQISSSAPNALDGEILRAVGGAVLPEELSEADRERAIGAFEVWLRGFRPNAEQRHPYGGWIIPYGPGDPEPRWAGQLSALQTDASRSGGSFADLSIGDRRALLEAAIEDAGERFPAPADADHIAVALMAHYFASPEANDRAHGVVIDKMSCRSIFTAGDSPPPLPD